MDEGEIVLRREAARRRLAGESPGAIARDLGRTRQWVAKWAARYDPHDVGTPSDGLSQLDAYHRLRYVHGSAIAGNVVQISPVSVWIHTADTQTFGPGQAELGVGAAGGTASSGLVLSRPATIRSATAQVA